MFRIVYVFNRKKELSLKKCQNYWKEIHAPLVQKKSQTLGILKYSQFHTAGNPVFNWIMRKFRNTLPPFDGVGEYWIDRGKLTSALNTDEGLKTMQELVDDEKKFIDLPGSCLWLAKEHIIIDSNGEISNKPVKKLTWVGSSLPELTQEQYKDHYLNIHAPLVKSYSHILGIKKYIQVHTVDDPLNDILRSMRGTKEPYPVHAEFIWDLKGMFSLSARKPMDDIAEDEKKFIDFTRSSIWMAEEHVVF